MDNKRGQPSVTSEELARAQLQIYAREFRQHFLGRRHLLQELREGNQGLEQRVREITALNQLFQEHLKERSSLVQAYRELREELRRFALQTSALAQRAGSQPLPEFPEVLASDHESATSLEAEGGSQEERPLWKPLSPQLFPGVEGHERVGLKVPEVSRSTAPPRTHSWQ